MNKCAYMAYMGNHIKFRDRGCVLTFCLSHSNEKLSVRPPFYQQAHFEIPDLVKDMDKKMDMLASMEVRRTGDGVFMR